MQGFYRLDDLIQMFKFLNQVLLFVKAYLKTSQSLGQAEGRMNLDRFSKTTQQDQARFLCKARIIQ